MLPREQIDDHGKMHLYGGNRDMQVLGVCSCSMGGAHTTDGTEMLNTALLHQCMIIGCTIVERWEAKIH